MRLDLFDVTDPSDRRAAPPERRARRSRRFVLPEEQHDERTAQRIEAFLHGSNRRATLGAIASARSGALGTPRELDTRADWTAAFRHESSRHLRYGRPASVLLLEIGRTPDRTSGDAVARELADLIRVGARASDRAVRTGPSSFRLLMPETTVRGARQVGARLEQAFVAAGGQSNHRPGLNFDVAAPTRGGSLEDALAEAERRVAR
jgi:GGDEF domain-containing protein